ENMMCFATESALSDFAKYQEVAPRLVLKSFGLFSPLYSCCTATGELDKMKRVDRATLSQSLSQAIDEVRFESSCLIRVFICKGNTETY
ncbi:MAG: hypothetical protein M8872_02200, partial [marine benthic group bacterium]|nr:hypothetical protein [Gemmatimonadota bacterium]